MTYWSATRPGSDLQGRTYTPFSPMAAGSGPYGPTITQASGASQHFTSSPAPVITSPRMTFMVVYAGTGDCGLCGYMSANTNNGARLQILSGAMTMIFGAVAVYNLGSAYSANVWRTLVVTITGNGGTVQAHQDGVASSAVAVGSWSTPSAPVFFVGAGWGGADPLRGSIATAAVWDRALSAGEAQALSLDPFQILTY